jgi:Protein of unknown function (DUF3467)
MSEEQSEQSPEPTQPSEATLTVEFFRSVLSELVEQNKKIHSVYCNNTQFQNSELDFKIVFGQLNQPPGGGKAAIDWHTAVTMAWAQAKMLTYYLRVNLAIYEATHGGSIKVPPGMLPGSVTAPNDLETNPVSKKVFEAVQQLQREFIDEQLGRTP